MLRHAHMPETQWLVSAMIRPATIPILFPYTSLFRSDPRRDRGRGGDPGCGEVPRRRAAGGAGRGGRDAGGREPRDRKSTRLNSSHLGISYAVFCSKKKTSNTS